MKYCILNIDRLTDFTFGIDKKIYVAQRGKDFVTYVIDNTKRISIFLDEDDGDVLGGDLDAIYKLLKNYIEVQNDIMPS